jgi:colicin import membrane protein
MPSKGSSRGLSSVLARGVTELPRNASWLLSKALSPVGEAKGAPGGTKKNAVANASSTPGNGIMDTMRAAGATVKDVLPGSGDSVELRLQRARAAADKAREAENRAVQSAEEAKAKANEAKTIAERDKVLVRDVRRDQAKQVEQRVAEARRAADAHVEDERAAAQSEADKVIADEEAQAQERLEKARDDAAAAQEQARAELSEATSRLAEARHLADEATAAAKAAAEAAHQQAEELASSAHHDAESADGLVAEAERVREHSSTSATSITRQMKAAETPTDFNDATKRELLDLAVAQGVESRSSMTKQELVSALKRAAR